MTPSGYDLGLPARRVGQALWASMLVMPLLFLGVVEALKEPNRNVDVGPPELLLALAVVTSAVGVFLSRVLPQRIPARQGGVRNEVTALTRLVVAWSLCMGVAIFPIIAYLISRHELLLAVLGVDLFALFTLYPSRERWDSYRAVPNRAPARDRKVH